MAAGQLAQGQVRAVKMDMRGRVQSESPAADITIFDNVVTPRVYVNNYAAATANDEKMAWDAVIDGSKQEILAIQLKDTSARTIQTTNSSLQLAVKIKFTNAKGQKEYSDGSLGLTDRITISTSGTRNDPRGLNDNGSTVANVWGDVFRLAPNLNEEWVGWGYWKIALNVTAV